VRVNATLPLLLTIAALLMGCNRQSDSFAPQIVITSPASDTVTPRSNLVIKGYAWDDKGVTKLVLNGSTDLLAKGALSAQRGRKIVYFALPADSLSGGKVSYELRAVDAGKRSAIREIKVTVDAVLPQLRIDSVDSQADAVAVSGTATDNQKVSRIAVNGEPLNVSPASKVQFYPVWATRSPEPSPFPPHRSSFQSRRRKARCRAAARDARGSRRPLRRRTRPPVNRWWSGGHRAKP
jgi:hypothetical protein